MSSAGISTSCVTTGFDTVGHNLPLILGALREAARRGTVIAGMNLYDPFLAEYLTGAGGQLVATESVPLGQSFNQLLGQSYRAFGAATADVQDAFSTTDSTTTVPLPGVGTVPLNVARVCEWTWMCAPSPAGPNIHANAAGYRRIAVAFERAIGLLGRRVIRKRMDKPASLQLLILEPGSLVRYEPKLTVEGLPEFRRSIGLDA